MTASLPLHIQRQIDDLSGWLGYLLADAECGCASYPSTVHKARRSLDTLAEMIAAQIEADVAAFAARSAERQRVLDKLKIAAE